MVSIHIKWNRITRLSVSLVPVYALSETETK